jgi:hypothetical protein
MMSYMRNTRAYKSLELVYTSLLAYPSHPEDPLLLLDGVLDWPWER